MFVDYSLQRMEVRVGLGPVHIRITGEQFGLHGLLFGDLVANIGLSDDLSRES